MGTSVPENFVTILIALYEYSVEMFGFISVMKVLKLQNANLSVLNKESK
jgi:predicted site-specific integrase-resolvase